MRYRYRRRPRFLTLGDLRSSSPILDVALQINLADTKSIGFG